MGWERERLRNLMGFMARFRHRDNGDEGGRGFTVSSEVRVRRGAAAKAEIEGK